MNFLNRQKVNRWLVLIIVVLLYWAIGFYPFQLPPYHNGVVRTADQILHFDGPGIAYSHVPPAWLPATIALSTLRVTLEVSPALDQKRRWARIFTLSENTHRSNLSIGQDGNDLIVHVRTPETDLSGKPGYVIDDVFEQPGWHRIEISVLPRLLVVMADGREVLRQVLPPVPLSNWSPEYRLAVGNELGFSRPWLGELRKSVVEAAGNDYDYALPNALETPAIFHLPLANRYIQWAPFADFSDGSSAVVDKIVNLFGFIPFGMILAMILRRFRSLLALTAICCVMSLSIETGQLFLATRTPSVDDLLLNTFGGALGAWLGLRIRARSDHG